MSSDYRGRMLIQSPSRKTLETNLAQLNPQPTEPLYVVGIRSVLLYLRELSDIEDLGLEDKDGSGVVTILADALHWKGPGTQSPRFAEEPWMDIER